MIPQLTMTSTTEVGAYGEHRQVIAEDRDQNQVRFIYWNGGDQDLPEAEFDVVCQLSKSDYKGSPQVSAEWVDFRITEKGREEIESRQFEIVDRRDSLNPIREITRFMAENPDSLVWGEGETPDDLPCKGRHELKPGANLVIWTAPASQSVLDAVLLQTKPKKVVVFGLSPSISTPKAFLQRLAGLAKYAIKNKDGKSTLDALASACASTTEAVRIGLRIWDAMGKLKINFQDGIVHFSITKEYPNSTAVEIYHQMLKVSLDENRAYRQYFHSGELNNYFPFTSGK